MVFASAERPVFTNHFLVELHKDGEEEARQVAAEHGFGVRKVRFFFSPCISHVVSSGGTALRNLVADLQVLSFLCYAVILPSVLKHDIASGDLSWVM